MFLVQHIFLLPVSEISPPLSTALWGAATVETPVTVVVAGPHTRIVF